MSSTFREATTGQRLKQLMQMRGLRQSEIVELAAPYAEKYSVRLGKNDLSAYIHERYLPAQDKLAILAMALDVSEAWLMGYDVPMERTYSTSDDTSAEEETAPIQQDERTGEFVRLFQELDTAHQETLLQVLRGLLAEQKACCGSRE